MMEISSLIECHYITPFYGLCLPASQGLNNKKNLPAGGTMLHCLDNIATFMEALPMDSPSNLWTTICNQFQTFLTKLPSVLPLKVDINSSEYLVMVLCDYCRRKTHPAVHSYGLKGQSLKTVIDLTLTLLPWRSN